MFERGQSNGLYLGVIHGVVLRSKPQNVVSNRLGGRGGIQLCFKAVPRVMCAARPLLSLFLSLSVSPSLVHALFCLCGACAGVHVPWLGWCPSPGVRASLATSVLPVSFFLSLWGVCWCPRPLAGVVSQSGGACVTGRVLPSFFFFLVCGVRVLVSTSLGWGGVSVEGCVRHWPRPSLLLSPFSSVRLSFSIYLSFFLSFFLLLSLSLCVSLPPPVCLHAQEYRKDMSERCFLKGGHV